VLYKISPAVVRQVLLDPMSALLGHGNKVTCFTEASLILRIHVEAVVSDVDSLASVPVWPLPLQCIYATVVDTIKGLHFRQGISPPTLTKIQNFRLPIISSIHRLGKKVFIAATSLLRVLTQLGTREFRAIIAPA
jgi:hypothetical protein